MAGRHGNSKVSVKNLEVIRIDKEKNYLLLKGSIPGPKGSVVKVVK